MNINAWRDGKVHVMGHQCPTCIFRAGNPMQLDAGRVMTARRSLRRVRRGSYKVGRVLGDVDAVTSGSPSRMAKRIANKWLGRNVVRRLWR